MDLTIITGTAATVVLLLTQVAKLIPIAFTSNYPAWVNAILSVIAASIIILPTFTFVSIAQVLGEALFIAVVAAVAYNQFFSRLFVSKI